jgi:ketosteroid isomerase-like protein
MTTTCKLLLTLSMKPGTSCWRGDISAFQAIWSETDDISHLGPMGATYTGRTAVMEEFAQESAMGLEGTLAVDDHQFVESAEMGYLVCMERSCGMTKAGEAIKSDIRATTIFLKESGQWRVMRHHTDRF